MACYANFGNWQLKMRQQYFCSHEMKRSVTQNMRNLIFIVKITFVVLHHEFGMKIGDSCSVYYFTYSRSEYSF